MGKIKVPTLNDMLEKAAKFLEEHPADEIDLEEMDIEETSNEDENPYKQDDWMRVQNADYIPMSIM